jgi:hypothetical protein
MRPVATKWLLLRNLPWAATKEEVLSQLQAKAPCIQTVTIKATREGWNRGLGFAAVNSEAERQTALAALKDFSMNSRKVIVMECDDNLQIDAPKRTYKKGLTMFQTMQTANHHEDYYP